MRLLIAAFLLVTPLLAEDKPKAATPVEGAVDIQPVANVVKDSDAEKLPNNSFKDLKAEPLKSGKVQFDIQAKYIQLGSAKLPKMPEKIEGVKVGRKAALVHFLHATAHGNDADAKIAKYVIHYTDKTKVDVPVLYAKHVADWWASSTDGEPSDALVGWSGSNEPAKANEKELRLYHMWWKNPNPEKEIATIDLETVDMKQDCALICMAITTQEKPSEPKKDK